MKLHRVRPGFYLHWPKEIEGDQNKRLMLAPGGVLDMDDAFVAKTVAGQEYKLVEDAEAKEPSLLDNVRFQHLRAQHGAATAAVKASAEAKPLVQADPSIPKPDPRPKKEEKKHGALSGAVSQGDSR